MAKPTAVEASLSSRSLRTVTLLVTGQTTAETSTIVATTVGFVGRCIGREVAARAPTIVSCTSSSAEGVTGAKSTVVAKLSAALESSVATKASRVLGLLSFLPLLFLCCAVLLRGLVTMEVFGQDVPITELTDRHTGDLLLWQWIRIGDQSRLNNRCTAGHDEE